MPRRKTVEKLLKACMTINKSLPEFLMKREEEKLAKRAKEFKKRIELARKVLKKSRTNPPNDTDILFFLIFSELRDIGSKLSWNAAMLTAILAIVLAMLILIA